MRIPEVEHSAAGASKFNMVTVHICIPGAGQVAEDIYLYAGAGHDLHPTLVSRNFS